MNLKEIEYIVTLAEEGKLARAAQRLFITPSALTQQVSNLEHEIGLPLFERSRSGWSPTRAGQIYLSSARQILQIRQETERRLQDLSDSQKGNLSIGVTSEHGTTTFTHIYPAFHKQFPEVTINIILRDIILNILIRTGKLDLGILTLSEEQQTEDLYIPLAQEEILLAIPSLHPACDKAVPTEKSPYPELDPNLVRYEPFAMMYKESTMYEVICQAFRIYGFYPETLFFAQRSATTLEMVSAGICCSVVPSYFAASSHPHVFEHVSYFSFPSHPVWNICASRKKGSYLSAAADCFIQLAQEYWGELIL